MKKAASVEKKLMVIDKGTSPFAQRVKRFEVVPPGEAPVRMIPMAVYSLAPTALATAKAKAGMKPYCEARPQNTAEGFWKARRKSEAVELFHLLRDEKEIGGVKLERWCQVTLERGTP